MTPEKLKRVEEIYHAALEIPNAERGNFVKENCGDDIELQNEINSLLSFEKDFNNFLDKPPESFVAEMVSEGEDHEDYSGKRISHYEIKELIGKGGMGAVYLAEDTRLERKVAVKFLNPNFSRNTDKLNRFIREAKSASALNHPNILTIHEIGETDGTKYIVTEFISGKTLREYILANGSISLDEILKICVQVAEALSTAHRAGIVHRDIKPENIMIRDDGYVKVLDFGLAKLLPQRNAENDNTIIAKSQIPPSKLTNPGMIMGTVSYMSPEQVRGQETDARTDFWSFGAMLYEMITRNFPFKGETASDTVAAILMQEPLPLSHFVENYPSELQRIVSKALTKNLDERYQNARELMEDLNALRRKTETGEIKFLRSERQLLENSSTNENEPTRVIDANQTAGNPTPETNEKYLTYSIEVEKIKSRYRNRTIAVIGLLLTGVLAYLGYLYFKPQQLVETAFDRTSFEKIPISGSVELTEISPDKRYLGYVERKGSNETRLVLRQLETNAEKEILPMGVGYVRDIEFSPDGNYFYYTYETIVTTSLQVNIFRVPLLGGEPEKVVENITRIFSLSSDGKKIAFVRNDEGLAAPKLIITSTKKERVLTVGNDREFQTIVFSPNDIEDDISLCIIKAMC